MKIVLPFMRSLMALRSVQLAATNHNHAVGSDTPTSSIDGLPPLDDGATRLFLVRHGDAGHHPTAAIDAELTDMGRYQAHRLGQTLRATLLAEGMDVVVSSHWQRASQTADILVQALMESTDANHHHHHPVRIINHKFGEMQHDAVTRTESVDDVAQRTTAGVQQVLRGFPHARHVCVVGHLQGHSHLTQALLGLTTTSTLPLLAPTAVHVVDVAQDGRHKAHVLNYSEHLYNPEDKEKTTMNPFSASIRNNMVDNGGSFQ